MKTWQKIKDEVQAEIGIIGAPVKAECMWRAYRNGQFLGTASSRTEAMQKFNAELVERVFINGDEIDAYEAHCRRVYTETEKRWGQALRDDYPHLSEEMFNLCLLRANRWTESFDYDEVADTMKDVVSFVQAAINLYKQEQVK